MFSLISSIALFFGLILLFFWKRNTWVLTTRRQWRTYIVKYLTYTQNQRLYYSEIHNIVATYDKMYIHFWKWELRHFVKSEDLELFDEIMTCKKEK